MQQHVMPALVSGCFLLMHVCLLQVYRGVLRKGGQSVAVKVQRPGVRESIALDIYILRWLAGELLLLLQVISGSAPDTYCSSKLCNRLHHTNTDSKTRCQQGLQFLHLLPVSQQQLFSTWPIAHLYQQALALLLCLKEKLQCVL